MLLELSYSEVCDSLHPICWCFAAIALNTLAVLGFTNTVVGRIFLLYGRMPGIMEPAFHPSLAVVSITPVSNWATADEGSHRNSHTGANSCSSATDWFLQSIVYGFLSVTECNWLQYCMWWQHIHFFFFFSSRRVIVFHNLKIECNS